MPLIYSAVFSLAALATILFGGTPNSGATLPAAVAVFETSLAAPITSSATSMTLAANSVRGGGSLSGYNCFTIDEGSAQAEYVCGTVFSTAVSSMTRGISPLTGTTTDSDLQFSHRRGANVKLTDFPLVQILKAQANGEDTYPNALYYANNFTSSFWTTAASNTIATYGIVAATAAAGAASASETVNGIAELATAAEAAINTSLGGTGARLVLPASLATSTPGLSTATGNIPTAVGRYLSQTWLDLTAQWTFSNLFATNASSTNATTTNFTVTGNTIGLPKKVYLTASPTSVTGNSATTSVFSFTMPSGLLSTNNFVETTVYVSGFAFANACDVTYEVGYGYSSTTVSIVFPSATQARSGAGTFKFILAANGATNAQKLTSIFEGMATTSSSFDFGLASSTALIKTATLAIDSTIPQNFGFNMKLSNAACFMEPAIVTSTLFN